MVKIEDVKGFALRMPEREINHDEGISLTMNRGDVVIFHDLLQHASHPNPARAERWALIPTYRCAAEVDSATIWKHPFLASGRSVNGGKAGGEGGLRTGLGLVAGRLGVQTRITITIKIAIRRQYSG